PHFSLANLVSHANLRYRIVFEGSQRERPHCRVAQGRTATTEACTNAEAAVRFQKPGKLLQRPGLLRQPVEDGVETDDVEARVAQMVKPVRVADPKFQSRARSCRCDLDTQRQWIDPQHIARRAGYVGNILRQETRAAANIEHSFARLDCEIPHEHLTGN